MWIIAANKLLNKPPLALYGESCAGLCFKAIVMKCRRDKAFSTLHVNLRSFFVCIISLKAFAIADFSETTKLFKMTKIILLRGKSG
jgi:hypothetical protein